MLVATAHPPFDGLDGLAGGVVDAEIDQGREGIGREGDVGRAGDGLCAEHQLLHAEHGADGRLLDHRDDLIRERGQDVFDRLRQHDEAHRRTAGEAQRAGRLGLPLVDSEDAGAEDLRDYYPWPQYEEAKCVESTVEIAVQVNGKVKARLKVATSAG